MTDPGAPQGLSAAEAARRLAADGPNALPAAPGHRLLRVLAGVVREPMFLLLLACGATYLVIGDRAEALMLLGFVVLVMGLSVYQQRRTERSLAALRDLSSPRAQVLRDGTLQSVAGRDLVCGDVVRLAEGERVPADVDLVEATNLQVDESMLTGESVPVAKRAGPAESDKDDAVRAFSGTGITAGTGLGRVVATGARSALGRIGAALAGGAEETTPLQAEVRRVVVWMAAAGLALAAALVVAWGLINHDWLQGLLAGLTLAMAVLPEELSVVLTLFLALGAWRLARERVLTRHIPAVERLGATTVLCVDKTGTLTANRMVLQTLWGEVDGGAGDGQRLDLAQPPAAVPENLHELLEFAVLASRRQAFDPMEQALDAAGAAGLAGTAHLHADWTLVEDYPLAPDLLAMTRVWRAPDAQALVIAAKGAPEAIADLCHLAPARRDAVAARVAQLAGEGLRVLGVARAAFDGAALPERAHDFDFAFLGLVALQDPVRPDVPAAVAACAAAGIRVVMMTGDHPATAVAIARVVGLPCGPEAVMSGADLAALDDAALRTRLPGLAVFCRVQPEQKLRIVGALRAGGAVVAMTGDGVNDAPALQAADIGVAMGRNGTAVAREAADLVLLDDDFGSLLTAVRYGRRVWADLRKAMVFVVAVHVPIAGLSILPVLLGWPMLLMPVHVLFLQLIIDPACAIVFEAEPLEAEAMAAGPRAPTARLFDAALLWRGVWQGGGLLAMLLAGHALARDAGQSPAQARALVFAVLVLANLGLIFANRAWARPSWAPGRPANGAFRVVAVGTVVLLAAVLGLAPLRRLFAFDALSPPMLAIGAGMALAAWLWFEAVKAVGRRR